MKLTKEQIKGIPMLLEGMTTAEIAVLFRVHARTVSYWIRRLRNEGIRVDTKPGRKPIRLIE